MHFIFWCCTQVVSSNYTKFCEDFQGTCSTLSISQMFCVLLPPEQALYLYHFTKYWAGIKVHLVFSIRWLQQCLFIFNFIQNNFVRLYCDSCHITVHLKNKTSKLVNFCVAILILRMEENTQYFQYIMLYYFKKVKMQLKCQKRFVQCVQKVL